MPGPSGFDEAIHSVQAIDSKQSPLYKSRRQGLRAYSTRHLLAIRRLYHHLNETFGFRPGFQSPYRRITMATKKAKTAKAKAGKARTQVRSIDAQVWAL